MNTRRTTLLGLTAALLSFSFASAQSAATPSTPGVAPTSTPASSLALSPALITGLTSYPSLTQARLALEAAQTQQKIADFPVSGTISASTTRILNSDDTPGLCTTNQLLQFTTYCAPLPSSVQNVNASLRATPFNYGDVGARRQLAQIAVDQARAGYQTALANLEGQVVVAALRAQLADSSVGLAQQSVQAAQMALQAIQTRFDGGGATHNELEQARLTLAQAQSAVQQSQENSALAHATLRDLTGSPEIPAVTPLGVPANMQSVAVAQAQFAVRRAQIAYEQARWNSLPNLQASYSHRLSSSSSAAANLAIGIDSRNVAPTASFSYGPATAPTNRITDQLTLGVSFDASLANLEAPALAKNALDQAQAGFAAAQRQSDLQLQGLNIAYQQAQRDLALRQQAVNLARQNQKDAEARRDLGLISPLEAAQAAVATYQAQLAADQATLSQTTAASNFYTFFGLPLTPLN
ncbi:TolC family protein [Deinococcus sp.]|uniref:TolC family protein n=1 Tax=Deinococcus sp. TaxID=47478 RepID=UPI0025C39A24|nr:TolC family protein [Deinococcus sp.]